MRYLADDNLLYSRLTMAPSVDMEYELLGGNLMFYQYNDLLEYAEEDISGITFYVLNCYEAKQFVITADHINGDVYYVAERLVNYCNSLCIGSTMIIDYVSFNENIVDFEEKIEIIEDCLKKTNEFFQILGVNTIAFMTKAWMLDLEREKRLILINRMMKCGYLPIYQSDEDVIMACNLSTFL